MQIRSETDPVRGNVTLVVEERPTLRKMDPKPSTLYIYIYIYIYIYGCVCIYIYMCVCVCNCTVYSGCKWRGMGSCCGKCTKNLQHLAPVPGNDLTLGFSILGRWLQSTIMRSAVHGYRSSWFGTLALLFEAIRGKAPLPKVESVVDREPGAQSNFTVREPSKQHG